MTREEAIEEINKAFEPAFANYIITALTEGVTVSDKTLEQKSCEDTVSRQAVLSMQYRIDDSATLSTRDVVNVDDIEALPPVILKPTECKDAVSREALLALKQKFYDNAGYETEYVDVEDIKELPPVTPKQRTGKWIRHTRVENVYDIAGVKTWGIKHQCDQCTFTTIAIEGFGYYDYCPNCGAKMEGESE